MTLPNFLIVGAARSGTTSLYNCLGQHPEVFMSPRKEPKFFLDGVPLSVRNIEEYQALFGGRTTEKAVGEASPQYLYDAEVPARIERLMPAAKIIIILRNPPDMAYSLWRQMALQLGAEKLSFEEALEKETERMSDPLLRRSSADWHINYHYFHRALYHDQVKRYLDVFGPEQVRVYVFEEFMKDPETTYRDIFGFLGVDKSFKPDMERHGGAKVFRTGIVRRLFFILYPLVKKVYGSLPGRARIGFYRLLRKVYLMNLKSHEASPLNPALREELSNRYAEDIRKLEGLLGREISSWRGGSR